MGDRRHQHEIGGVEVEPGQQQAEPRIRLRQKNAATDEFDISLSAQGLERGDMSIGRRT